MKIRSASTDRLMETICKLDNVEDCYRFFEDLCTIKELQDMSQRLDAAALLDKGVSYKAIMEELNISSATVSRVNRCLNYGEGGYRTAIAKMAEKEEKTQ